MNNMQKRRENILRLTQLSILIALVIIFQLVGSFIHIGPTSVSLVLLPIALGAMLMGPASGALLGLVFGAVTLIMGIVGADPFTFILFGEHPIITSLLCLGKGAVAGLVGGTVYKAFERVQRQAATFVCAIAVPVVNTGLFILGGLMMSGTLSANFVPEGTSVIYFLVIGCAGLNFIAELLVNLIAAPALSTVYDVVKNKISR